MKQKTIGIIGGAGPLAGAALLDRILTRSQYLYGCFKDADFPKVNFISYPFSDMLAESVDEAQIRNELKECLCELRKNGATVIAIACNTLHAFLVDEDKQDDLIQLPQILAEEVADLEELPLVLCTSTSANTKLHKRFFRCVYPEVCIQAELDQLIDLILIGEAKETALQRLILIIRRQKAKVIVLGCTELSLLRDQIPELGKKIIDPLDIAARRMLKIIFEIEVDKK